MIIDHLKYWKTYTGVHPLFETAVNFALSVKDQQPGRYDCDQLEPGAVYALVQEGSTQSVEDGKMESHCRYLDVQIMLDGAEVCYYDQTDNLECTEPYDENKDVFFYRTDIEPETTQRLVITSGMFYVLFPQDGHLPGRMQETSEAYRKIVLKIRVD